MRPQVDISLETACEYINSTASLNYIYCIILRQTTTCNFIYFRLNSEVLTYREVFLECPLKGMDKLSWELVAGLEISKWLVGADDWPCGPRLRGLHLPVNVNQLPLCFRTQGESFEKIWESSTYLWTNSFVLKD